MDLSIRITLLRGHRHVPGIGAVLLALAAPLGYASDALSPEIQSRVRAETFEVVLRKPKTDSLTYEKPLPLDLLPYIQRTDEYLPIGTAFAIGNGRYVSAVHVIVAGMGSQFGEPALRDGNNRVFEMDKILKSSLHEDFVVFSLKDAPQTPGFEFNLTPKLNEVVYAVGNAHGEGVVIRDGLYTSDTPEQQDGRWKWLRFSAAASPGNSGGPLLDAQGRVIGVVLRKSASENLNYAVSIAQVANARDNVAVVDTKMHARLPIMEATETAALKHEFALPLSFGDFDRVVTRYFEDFGLRLKKELLRRNADRVFPRGDGSAMLLHSVYTAGFPHLVAQKADGTWDVFYPEEIGEAELPENGYVAHGSQANSTWVRVRRPDDVTAAQLYADSKLYMDWLLKAIAVQRRVGPENVRVLSFGKARETSMHVDAYGRKWQVHCWPIEYNDTTAISFSLPTPEGYAAMVRTVSTQSVESNRAEMQILTDYVYVSYGGSLSQWREFLAEKPLLPAAFAGIDIDFEYGQDFHYRSQRLALSHTRELQKITEDSYLTLSFAFFNEGDATVWDVGGVSLMEDIHSDTMLAISRRPRPAKSMPDSEKSDWDKLAARQFPYNATPIPDDGATAIHTLYTSGGTDVVNSVDPEAVIYEVSYIAEGEQGLERMSSSLGTLIKGVNVHE
jgi:hypothetical protein